MTAQADILTIEIGSTLTKVIAFRLGKEERILGRAECGTTPDAIMVGLRRALDELHETCGIRSAPRIYASSSAAGGLRMTVHGLTRDLTARAAEEATLGAGANVKLITAGPLSRRTQKKVEELRPNLIMLAGGVDFGEEETVLHNARLIAEIQSCAPVVYGGNTQIQDEVRELFEGSGHELFIVDNVYPSFNELNVGPVREIVQRIFSERLVIAPGMEELRDLARGAIWPVPAVCLRAAEQLSRVEGNLVVVDVGGATTDVHSVLPAPAPGNLDPHLVSRRTVEGDLGVFVNAETVWQKALGREGSPTPLSPKPRSAEERSLSAELARACVERGILRHAGAIIHGAYTADGSQIVKGRDLRNVGLVVGAGGAAARLDNVFSRCRELFKKHANEALVPPADVRIAVDGDNVFSACGAFGCDFPDAALSFLRKSLRFP